MASRQALFLAAYLTCTCGLFHLKSEDRKKDAVSRPDDVQRDFFQSINARIPRAPVRELEFWAIPDAALVVFALRRSKCAAKVGGEFRDYVKTRLETTKYLRFSFSAARKVAENRILGLLAISNVTERRIGLMQPFFSPSAARTEIGATGVLEVTNLLPQIELTHGFRTGSLTERILRALMVLHEQGHLNHAIPVDDGCLPQSMHNTRDIAEACFEEIVEPLSEHLLTAFSTSGCVGGRR
ncbi:MAG: hypothetical protein HZB13_05925 [Acidobacteria bacterium]|nr:hypothetical protein [Acidobacteriota bacterium]